MHRGLLVGAVAALLLCSSVPAHGELLSFLPMNPHSNLWGFRTPCSQGRSQDQPQVVHKPAHDCVTLGRSVPKCPFDIVWRKSLTT